MMRNEQQIVNGIVAFIDGEIMPKMTTTGKWIVGAWSILAMERAENLVHSVVNNPLISALGVKDENGNIDTDKVIGALYNAAGKYGTTYMEVPLVGRMGFTHDDVNKLGNYINRQ